MNINIAIAMRRRRATTMNRIPNKSQQTFCSSYNQRKEKSHFGRFFTCNSYRKTNRKARQQRNRKLKEHIEEQERSIKLSLPKAERHLQMWQDEAGEVQVKAKARQREYEKMVGNQVVYRQAMKAEDNAVVLYKDRRKPLILEDYIEDSPYNIKDPKL
jgi:hypothetical protein